jgi:lysophospholipase L1-like esterase
LWSTASTGSAGSTTGAGNNWTDVNGGVWQIQSDQLKGTPDSTNNTQYERDFLTRPSGENEQDQQIIIDTSALPGGGWNGACMAALRVQNNGNHDAYLALIDGSGNADLYSWVGGTLTLVHGASYTYTSGDTYELTAAVYGVSPTNYSFQVVNTTTSTTVASFSGTDSTSGLQTSGMYGIDINGNTTSSALEFTRVRTYNDTGLGMSLAPSSGNTSQAISVTATGVSTSWVSGTTTFSVSGGTGTSISGLTISSTTSATFTLHTGSSAATLTISDSSDSATANFTVTLPPTTINVNDTNWFFSPYNWYVSGSSYAQTNNPGAYFKIGFTGTSVQLNVNTSALSGGSTPSGEYPILQYSIDDAAWTQVQLTSGNTVGFSVSGLASGTHQLICYVVYSEETVDRWTTPVNVVQITSLTLDPSTASAAPTLQSKRMIVYGDSITEGTYANGTNASHAAGNNSSVTYAIALAQAFSAEVGVIGFGRQGWGIGGNGNVPTLPNSWNLYWSGQSRLVSSLLSPSPNYVVIVEGTNDALNGISSGTVTSDVAAFQATIQAAAPSAKILFVVPFGQFMASAVTAGVTVAGNVYLINLGTVASSGLTDAGSSSKESADTVHPNTPTHGRLAAMLAQAIQAVLVVPSAPAVVRSNSYSFLG